jgi:hypothetical protein
MPERQQRLERELQRVAAQFAARLPERLALLAKLWDAHVAGEDGAPQALQRELHRLRGTAASYGYAALARQLRVAEDLLTGGAQAAELSAAMATVLEQQWLQDEEF